jgi:DNA-binding PadR family transcriptional regulator
MTVRDRDGAAMRSPVYWAVLGLIIERPSYGYELVQRFERTYGELLNLSSPSQIYTALDTLARRALIEELPAASAAQNGVVRQPKPHYRATAAGERDYQERLIAQVGEGSRRSRLFALELAALPAQRALAVIDRYEQACLEEARRTPPCEPEDRAGEAIASLAERLAREETRLTMQARLPWIEYARRQFRALLGARAQRR